MKVRTADGRLFEIEAGTLFDCSIQEDEWFPRTRSDIFSVGFLREGEAPNFRNEPVIGDCVAVDFQQDGPFGEVWLSNPIVEIIEEESYLHQLVRQYDAYRPKGAVGLVRLLMDEHCDLSEHEIMMMAREEYPGHFQASIDTQYPKELDNVAG